MKPLRAIRHRHRKTLKGGIARYGIKDKKAQIFILSAIALMALFFVSYSVYSSFNQRTSISSRVKTMDSFLFSMEKDLERQLYTSGFRIIFLAQDKVTRTAKHVENFDEFFQEAIINGSVEGEASEILVGSTIEEIITKIEERGNKMNVIINFSEINVSMGQDDAWRVFVLFEAVLNLTDKSNLASWNKKEKIKSYIEITNFEDPVYFVSTNGKVSRKISQTPYEGNYVLNGDKTNLTLHLEGKYYAANPMAPSFLDRIKGIKLPSENGIESFVYIPELSAQGASIYEKSVVDYIYFSPESPSYSSVSGMPAWFLVDDEHREKYQVS